MKRLLVLFIVLSGSLALAQTTINGSRIITGNWDASGAASTKACKSGAIGSRPANCTVGECYFDTGAVAGANISLCTTTGTPGTWTVIAGASPSDVAYDAGTWDANMDAATKNRIRDKFESLTCGGLSGCVPSAITDGNSGWDNSYNFIVAGDVAGNDGVPLAGLADYGNVCAANQSVARDGTDANNVCITPLLSETYTGTVTTVSIVTANGVSGSVATATTTPAVTLTLGAITPSGITLPSGSPTAEGSIGWDGTNDYIKVGDGAASQTFVPTGTLTDTKFCTWDNTGKEIDCNSEGGGSSTAYLNKTVELPTNAENITLAYFESAVTIDEVTCVTMGASSTATVKVRFNTVANRTTTGTEVLGAGEPTANAIVCDTSGEDDSVAFNDATIDAGSWVWIVTTATTNSPTELHINVRYH